MFLSSVILTSDAEVDKKCEGKLSAILNISEVIKAPANEDTLLPTQMLPRLPARAKFVADTKNASDFVQKHFVSATNVSQFAQHGNTTFIHHGQQCVRNNVSSFARAFKPGFQKIANLFERNVSGSSQARYSFLAQGKKLPAQSFSIMIETIICSHICWTWHPIRND